MGILQIAAEVTRFPLVYRAWQAPFVLDKIAPLIRRGELLGARRVLDVGCGPGTNAPQFEHANYVGIDISERYIQTAQRRHAGTFVTADVSTYEPEADARFDFVLINSLLHHLDENAAHHILDAVAQQLDDGGHVHILELVLPTRPSPAWLLAKADRGHYPRPLESWRGLFCEHFDERVFEPYAVRRFGVDLWQMVYFKGGRRS